MIDDEHALLTFHEHCNMPRMLLVFLYGDATASYPMLSIGDLNKDMGEMTGLAHCPLNRFSKSSD